jgi:hypothetical protein
MNKLIFRIIKKERRAWGSGQTDVQTAHRPSPFPLLFFFLKKRKEKKKRVLSAMQTQFT